MARESVFGNCAICGEHKKLAFGHVPPQSAFNKCPAVGIAMWELINKNPDHYFEERKRISQRGIGDYTLCDQCDNDTGSWYGEAFAKWAHQGMEILDRVQGEATFFYPFRIYPLRVIKQIVVMFFSIRDLRFAYNHPDVVQFVLNRNERYLNPDIHIYAFLNISGCSRYIEGASRIVMNPAEINRDSIMDMNRTASAAIAKGRVLSEIACRPLGYVMSFDPTPPDDRLSDISHFAEYSYSDWTPLYVKLSSLPLGTYLPLDYRDHDQVERDAEKNRRDDGNNNATDEDKHTPITEHELPPSPYVMWRDK